MIRPCRTFHPGRLHYTENDITAMLIKAEQMGYDLSAGCELEKLTLIELDHLVNTVKGT